MRIVVGINPNRPIVTHEIGDYVDFRIVEREVKPGTIDPENSRMIELYESDHIFRLSENGNLYVQSTRVSLPRTRGHGYGGALKLRPEDHQSIEDVIEHWNKIRWCFVREVQRGQAMVGYTGSTYVFPDGRILDFGKFGTDHAERHGYTPITEPLDRVQGNPIDNLFPSNGCVYIEGHPLKQHYRHGRFDFFLEKDDICIEDENSIQSIAIPELVCGLLRFIGQSTEDAIDRIREAGRVLS